MRESTQRRVRRSLTEWRTICEQFARGGLGVEEFCLREKLTVSNFKKWSRRCRREGQQSGQFIELVPPALGTGRWEVEITLPNGTRLHLRG
jgi:putative transposase